MALAHCILGNFLGVVCHCFPPPLDVPTFAARCLYVRNDARKSTTWDRRLYFPSEGRRAEDFFTLKIRRLWPGLNPRTWVLKASTLPLDHWSTSYNNQHVAFHENACSTLWTGALVGFQTSLDIWERRQVCVTLLKTKHSSSLTQRIAWCLDHLHILAPKATVSCGQLHSEQPRNFYSSLNIMVTKSRIQ